MRDLQIDEDVLGREGQRLGKLERIVVDERGDRVTHLVVDDRVIELKHFRDAGADGLYVDVDATELHQFPTLEESEFAAPAEHWQAPAGFRLQNFLAAAALFAQAPYQPPVRVQLPRDERAHEITAGSPVWSGDVKLGEVDHVLADDSGKTTHFVLRREGLRGHHVLIPVASVVDVVGNNMRVNIAPHEVDKLQAYSPSPKRTS